VGDLTVLDAANLVEELRARGIKVAMLAVPADQAQEVAHRLVEAGVRGILNYAPINIATSKEVRVQYIDPVIHLQRMTFYLDHK
jgi:redox-sensing transcriptional repressor